MKTAEEKAKEYAEEAIEALYSDSELMQDFVQKLKKYAKVDFLAGYNEAMRWRDPKEELPEGGILVQIKFDSSEYKGHPYSHDVFLPGLNRWNIEHHADIKVTGWRPIE